MAFEGLRDDRCVTSAEEYPSADCRVCGSLGCTRGAINQAVSAVKKGCKKDLDAKHYMAVVALALLEDYEITKKVACRKQQSANQYCVSQVIKDFQEASGKIFIPSFFSAVAAQPIAFLNSLEGVSLARLPEFSVSLTIETDILVLGVPQRGSSAKQTNSAGH